jgi:hypothetical protein
VLFSLCNEGGRGGHGGGVRPVTMVVVLALHDARGGRRPTGVIGEKGQGG